MIGVLLPRYAALTPFKHGHRGPEFAKLTPGRTILDGLNGEIALGDRESARDTFSGAWYGGR